MTSRNAKKILANGGGFRAPGRAEEAAKKAAKNNKIHGKGFYDPRIQSLAGKTAVSMKKGIHAPGNQSKGGSATNAQVWESTVDGFRSNPGAVACHNKANGWDPAARVRIS